VERNTASLWGKFERAYNRGDEVFIPMGFIACLERRGLWARRWFVGNNFRCGAVLCAHEGAGKTTDRAGGAEFERSFRLSLIALALLGVVLPTARADKLSVDERLEIERGLNAEFATMRVALPRAKRPLVFKSDGTFDQKAWDKAMQENGPAARLGDEVQITRVEIQANRIVLEINGGTKTGHWYDHVQVGMGGTMGPVATDPNGRQTANGSHIALVFPQSVPSLKASDIRQILHPIFDFEKHSAAEQYMDKLPEPIKKAIKEQKAIEGMDKDQVLLALGKPRNKSRETSASGDELEDWIYGDPPGKMTFVRFSEGKVIKVSESYANVGGMTAPPLPPPR
jgi:hypothetical protein